MSFAELPLDLFPDAKFHHTGMVVPSIAQLHPDLDTYDDSTQKVRVAFLNLHGLRVELVEPLGDDAPVKQSLEQGKKLLHLCFEVKDLQAAVAHGQTQGFSLLAPPVPAVAFDQKEIAWMLSPHYGLVELLQA